MKKKDEKRREYSEDDKFGSLNSNSRSFTGLNKRAALSLGFIAMIAIVCVVGIQDNMKL